MDSATFSKIVDNYQKAVIAVIYKMVSSWETARDLAQEVFLKLWKQHRSVNTQLPLYPLLYKIAINLAIDHLRKIKPLHTGFDQISENSLPLNLEKNELFEVVIQCSEKLKPKQKAIFVLRDLEGMTFEEISKILSMPEGNIRSNLHLARKNVKERLFKLYKIDEEYFYDL